MRIEQFIENTRIESPLLVVNLTKGVTGNNQSYLTVTFQDKTGTIEGKKWDARPGDEELFAIGNFVLVEADVLNYRGNLQLKIISSTVLNPETIDITQFTISSPIPQKELEAKLKKYLSSFQDKEVSLIVNTLIQRHYDQFVTYPAAVRNHHEFANGLLYHTLAMADLGERIAELYPSINRDLLLGGIFLHDLGKTVELSGPVISKYTVEGRLIGHIPLAASEILQVGEELGITSEVPMLLTHMVLAHHGKLEFGSPVLPATREALALSMIDNFDSKMMMVDKALADIPEGEWTPRLWALDDSYFYQPKKR
ncbi:MAG: 3'-5' exoribonuclease YhaM family protein [Bacilli bacterium]|jgi:3'-5' exoribonuclease